MRENLALAMTPISDLLNLPAAVHRGDFVLRLSEGITDAHADGTLCHHVVTPAFAENFHDALGFIRDALRPSAAPWRSRRQQGGRRMGPPSSRAERRAQTTAQVRPSWPMGEAEQVSKAQAN